MNDPMVRRLVFHVTSWRPGGGWKQDYILTDSIQRANDVYVALYPNDTDLSFSAISVIDPSDNLELLGDDQ